MALEQWAPRALDQSREDPTKTIQLTADGRVFETWGAPFPPVEEWVTQARAVIMSIAEESPKGKRVELLFSCIGTTSNELTTTCPTSVTGKNAAADSMIGGGGNTAKAFSDAFVGIVATMNAVNKAAFEMVTNVTTANKALTEQIVDLREYFEAQQDEAIAAKARDSGPSANEFIIQQLKDAGPLAMEAFSLWLDGQKNKALATAGKAVVSGINGTPATTNGVSTS